MNSAGSRMTLFGEPLAQDLAGECAVLGLDPEDAGREVGHRVVAEGGETRYRGAVGAHERALESLDHAGPAHGRGERARREVKDVLGRVRSGANQRVEVGLLGREAALEVRAIVGVQLAEHLRPGDAPVVGGDGERFGDRGDVDDLLARSRCSH